MKRVYKRIRLVRIACTVTVAVFCFTIWLSPVVRNMACIIDSRNRKCPGLPGNNTYERLTNSNDRSFLSNRVYTRKPTISSAAAANFIPITIRNIRNTFKDLETEKKTNKKPLTVSVNNNSMQKGIVTNTKELDSSRNNSTMKRIQLPHSLENAMEMIATGRYIPDDLMKEGPFHFLKNYKNPCWVPAKRNSTEPAVRCLPYFYLIGAPKSGTTDLHRRLTQHPDVSRLVVKEPHWLTRKHYYSFRNRTRSGLANYLKYFTYATLEIYRKENASRYHSTIFGDCSASTMWDNDYWTILPEFRNLSEPRYTNADYIHHLNPNTKFIAILRNPIDRLYSDYLFFHHGSPQLFHKGVVNVINETHECLKINSLRHCLYTPRKPSTGINIRLRIGVYHLHLKEYLRVFPPEQVMVIKLEDFSNNIAAYMQRLFAFLEIPEVETEDLERIADPEKHANPRRERDRDTGEMLPETRELLQEFYRPHNDLLTELFGEKFNYNRDRIR